MTSKLTRSSSAIGFGEKFAPTIRDMQPNPKFNMYQSDGFGRDSYIKFDNGGFRSAWDNKFRIIHTNQCELIKPAKLHAKFPVYKSNGYGRDSYIYEECGGFYQGKTFPIVDVFYTSLRKMNNWKSFKKNDYLIYTQQFKSLNKMKEERKLSQKQRITSARLAVPKRINSAKKLNI